MPYLFDTDMVDNEISGGGIINTCTMTFMMLLFVPIGWQASKWDNGAVKIIRIGQIGLFIVAVPAYLLINTRTVAGAIIAQLMLGVFVACVGSGLPYFLIMAFPPKVRTFAVGIAYNLAQAVFGGVTPVTCTALAKEGHPVLPAAWLMFVALISIVSLCIYEARSGTSTLSGDVELEEDAHNRSNPEVELESKPEIAPDCKLHAY